MTRRFVISVGATAVAVALAGGAYVAAQGRGPIGPGGRRGFGGPGGAMDVGPGGPVGPWGIRGILGPVDLSDDQRDRVRQILDSHREEQQALAERGRTSHQALDDAITGGTFDERAIRSLAAAAADVDADMAVERARIVAEVFEILTPEQRAAIKKARDERQARLEKRLERMKETLDRRRGR